ncbi:MAG: hypothetical protein Kow0062_13400 [Acidobacteriota bacterium]
MRPAVVLAVLFSAAALAADQASDLPFPADEIAHAREVLRERLAGCDDANRCAGIYATIALAERPGGALEELARRSWIANIGRTRATLFGLFPRVPPASQAEILDAFREHWPLLMQGVFPELTGMVVQALESDDDAVRLAAARLIATRPVARISHAAIDAAELDPSLLQAAILAVGHERARYAARWLVETATAHDAPGILEAARWSLFRLDRKGADRLKELIDSADPDTAARAVDLLLVIAIPADGPVLLRWLEQHGSEHPELAERVRRQIAALEAGLIERRSPPFPQLVLPEPPGS